MKKLWWIGIFLAGVGAGLLWPKGQSEEPEQPPQASGIPVQHTSFVCRELIAASDHNSTAALLVENTGNIDYTDAQIVVVQDGRRLYFEIEFLPAESRVLVMEKDSRSCRSDQIDSCYCLTAIPEGE